MGAKIDQRDVEFPQKRHKDAFCRVFYWRNQVLRGIVPEYESGFRALLSTTFFKMLTAEDFFPETRITDYEMTGFPLILEHAKIWPVVYPQEWTFSMLQDAAILVLDIAQLARSHGFNMKDCHGLNVLFEGTKPRFVDLGSFFPDETPGWVAYEEFLRFYIYPLKIWRYNGYFGKLCIFSGNLISHEDYRRIERPIFRRLNSRLLSKLVRLQMGPEVLAAQPAWKLKGRHESRLKARIRRVFYTLVARRIFPTNSLSLARNVRRVRSMKQKWHRNCVWGDYHQQIKTKEKRFYRILEIVTQIGGGLETAVDIAGNQGKFSRLLVQSTSIKKAVCIDYDEKAVDMGYRWAKADGVTNVTFAHLDFMAPVVKASWSLPHERFRCDAAFALALTHHLLLSQNYDIDEILQRIGSYASKYVFVEFMPKGLWVSGADVKVPGWYRLEWFKERFLRTFNLVHEEQIAVNNVLFVGRVIPLEGSEVE